MKNKIMLITYADSFGRNLKELKEMLDTYFRREIGAVHILPFFPSSGDRGFSPMTYEVVDPAFGTWEDVEALAKDYELMFDFMINHLSRRSDYFLDFIEKTFQEKLDIEFPDLEGMIEEDQDDCIHFTYRFFITNFKQNFVNLVLNYIEKHKKEICDFLPKKKDVSTLTFRKDIEDPDDILILTNLDEIIDYALSRGFTVEEFLDLIDRDEPSLERYLLEQYYDEAKIVGNFLDKYFRMVTRNFKIEIECAVRNDILKKYLKFL